MEGSNPDFTPEQAAIIEGLAKEAARHEVASFAGLLLGRIERDAQDDAGNVVDERFAGSLTSAIAEALRDFGGTIDQPGGDHRAGSARISGGSSSA